MPATIDDPVQFLKGVGPARARDFEALGIRTIRDLVSTFPRDLSDRSRVVSVAEAIPGQEVTLLVHADELQARRPRGGRVRCIVTGWFSDDTGGLEATWFNADWLLEQLPGRHVLLFGKIQGEGGRLKLQHPQYEVVHEAREGAPISMGRIVPIYPCTGKLTQTAWRKVMTTALELHADEIADLFPPEFLRERDYPSRAEAIREMHFPSTQEARQRAEARLIYEECLLLQLLMALTRLAWEGGDAGRGEGATGRAFAIGSTLDDRIRRLFPFRLTQAQDKALAEILADLRAPKPMHRLLQGDVGSGKTVVALYAMLAVVANKAQVCLMAPTSLLARQHHHTTKEFLANSKQSRVKVALLVGGMKKAEVERVKGELAAGTVDILVATHAAIQEDVLFRDLGLVVIDEQHKFGVRQRAMLVDKGIRADVLVMTATPIPRSLAMTVYGDLEVSTIDGLPPGRKPVATSVPSPKASNKVWEALRQALGQGRQAFVVSPLLEESLELDVCSATEAFERLQAAELSGFKLELIHGKMKRDEQAAIMERFRTGAIDVLVSTVVIEVGVDVPNANWMVVLHAERFGLAQLHQLRGRIGRGNEQGHFVLLSNKGGEEARTRLRILASTQDGFEIAEEDLKIRGPGQLLGTRQHGLPELKLVDLVRDFAIMAQARADARALVSSDPELSWPEHRALRAELDRVRAALPEDPGVG